MGLAVAVHDLALVVDNVLHGEGRADHLASGAVVVELSARQGDYGYLELAQFRIGYTGIGAQGASEV